MPTQIVNKNGITTTVHRKISSLWKGNASAPPPPVLEPVVEPPAQLLTESERADMIDKICTAATSLASGYNYTQHKSNKDCIEAVINNYSDETLIPVNEYFNEDTGGKGYFAQVLANLHPKDDGTRVREYLALRTFTQDMLPDPDIAISMIRELHRYEQTPDIGDYSKADEETKEKLGALLITTSFLRSYFMETSAELYNNHSGDTFGDAYRDALHHVPIDNDNEVRLTDERLIKLILDNPHEAVSITNFILRDKLSVDLIKEKIESDIPSLREGML